MTVETPSVNVFRNPKQPENAAVLQLLARESIVAFCEGRLLAELDGTMDRETSNLLNEIAFGELRDVERGDRSAGLMPMDVELSAFLDVRDFLECD